VRHRVPTSHWSNRDSVIAYKKLGKDKENALLSYKMYVGVIQLYLQYAHIYSPVFRNRLGLLK